MAVKPLAPLMVFYDQGRHEQVTHLRGGPFFDTVNELGIGKVYQLRNGTIGFSAFGTAFHDVGQPGVTDRLLEAKEKYGESLRLIADVHFPFMQPGFIEAFQPVTRKQRNKALDKEVRDLWLREDTRRNAIAIMEAADAITAPRWDWLVPLRKYNANLHVLPDVVDLASAEAFARGWLRVIANLTEATTGRRIFFQRSRTWFAARSLRSALATHLKTFEEDDDDART